MENLLAKSISFFSNMPISYAVHVKVSGRVDITVLDNKRLAMAVPIVAPIALCGFYSYNGMGFREVFTRYMRSIFRNKTLVFKSGGYREMTAEIRAGEEAEKRAAIRKAKEERRRSRKEKIKSRIKEIIKKSIRKTERKGRDENG